LPNCSAEQVKTAYFKLVRLDESKRLTEYIAADRSPRKAYRELHHFRVFLDEHGCHEIFAESFTAVPESGRWQ
jgi:phosphoribosylformylglycinamidine (FGAM) synthase-like enzyme